MLHGASFQGSIEPIVNCSRCAAISRLIFRDGRAILAGGPCVSALADAHPTESAIGLTFSPLSVKNIRMSSARYIAMVVLMEVAV
jgi:hypothetical protein